MSEIKYYSEEGLQKLKDELHHLIAFERPAAAAAIAEARDKGDLSENAEYDASRKSPYATSKTTPNRSIPSSLRARRVLKKAKYLSRLPLHRPFLVNVLATKLMLWFLQAPCNLKYLR